jgi:hypothetical protein
MVAGQLEGLAVACFGAADVALDAAERSRFVERLSVHSTVPVAEAESLRCLQRLVRSAVIRGQPPHGAQGCERVSLVVQAAEVAGDVQGGLQRLSRAPEVPGQLPHDAQFL